MARTGVKMPGTEMLARAASIRLDQIARAGRRPFPIHDVGRHRPEGKGQIIGAGAGDHVDFDPGHLDGTRHADVRQPSRRAAAQCQANPGPRWRCDALHHDSVGLLPLYSVSFLFSL